jgi:hypothetical protein
MVTEKEHPEDDINDPENQKLNRELKNLTKMHGLKSFLVTFFGGLILFGTPAVVLMIMDSNNVIDILARKKVSFITSLQPQLTRWSLWITSIWTIFVLLQFLVYYLPKIIIGFITAAYGSLTESTRMMIDYIPALQPWIVWAIWQPLAVLSFQVIFSQHIFVEEWQITYNCLWTLTIFAEIFLVQQVLVQKLAFNFHKYYVFDLVFLI